MTPRRKKLGQVTIAKLGAHGQRVRIFRQGDLVRVQSRALGLTKSYRGADAEAQALGFAEALVRGLPEQKSAAASPTVAELWNAYTESSDYRQLRERSRAYYLDAWNLFVSIVPLSMLADDVTVRTLELMRTTLEDVKRERTGRPLALNTIRKAISIIKSVWTWGERTEMLTRNRIHRFMFKVGKEKKPVPPDEYTREEFERLLGGLSFDRAQERTPFCVLALCGYQGARINAVVHLRWEDIDWEADTLAWRARWDKMGNEWAQPLRAPTRAVLARLWDAKGRPASGWVFPARANSQHETYTPGAFIWVLHQAEKRVGIEPKPGRAAHGFRRMLAGDLAEKTGSGLKAMHAIGDNDERMAKRYVKRRLKTVGDDLRSLDREESA